MLDEISVLPKQNEEFSKGQMATSVMFVGHRSTTRHEQIQENWHIEINPKKKSKQPLRRSPRKATMVSNLPQPPCDESASEDSDGSGASDASDDGSGASADASDGSDTMSHSDVDEDDVEVEKRSSKKRLEFDDTPTRKAKRKSQKHNNQRGKKKPRKTSVLLQRDLIAIAKAGDPAPLNEYINNFDLDRAVRAPKTNAQWEKVLPAWKSKTKARGLKSWQSKTTRGEWDVTGICAKVINQAVKTYMEIFGLPPVFESDKSGEKIIKPNGIDLFTPFMLTVHLDYCKNLNPEVEDGTFAFDKVLQYMHTHRVRIKLLRAVCTHQDTHTMHSQDTYPLFQDTYPPCQDVYRPLKTHTHL